MINFPDSPTSGQEFTASGKTWKWDGTAWTIKPGGAADPHAGDEWEIRLNPTNIDENVSVPTGWNGVTAGPVSIDSGKTVDVASGSTWTVV